MMIKLVKLFLFAFLSILIIFSCVKEGAEDATSIQERILKAYIEVNHPNARITPSGIYIVDSIPGTGPSMGDSAYAYVRYSTRNLAGDYQSSTYDSIAKQLGTYHKENFYGTHVWFVGKDSIASGMEEVMRMMKFGGKIKAILPPWTLDEESGDQINSEGGSSKIYDIELDTFVVNIENYQIEQLKDYASKKYPDVNPLEGYEGFYFKETHDGGYTEAKDTIPDEQQISIKYIGKLLDGTVFDTNIADSALRYDLSEPQTMNVIYYKDFEKMKEENEHVDGFLLAISEMGGYQDKCVTFFDSSYGYGATGNFRNNNGIPGYYPIFFEIWIDDEPDDD